MYELVLEERVKKKFNQLAKKDKKQAMLISKTIKKILQNPFSSKPLKKPMQGLRREHVGSFVLVFSINRKSNKVIIEAYKHHDEVYKSP